MCQGRWHLRQGAYTLQADYGYTNCISLGKAHIIKLCHSYTVPQRELIVPCGDVICIDNSVGFRPPKNGLGRKIAVTNMAVRLSSSVAAWRVLCSTACNHSPSSRTAQPWVASSFQGRQQCRLFTTPVKEKDYYAILNISPNATHGQVKDAYYKLSMTYHPDHNKGSEDAHQKFTEITEAYSVLGKYELRRKYDKGMFHKEETPHTEHRRPSKHHKGTVRPKFNFDEFYRMHYGEALRRHQRQTHEKKAAKDRAEEMTVPTNVQRFLIACVATSIFLGGWYLAFFRKHNRTKVGY